MLYQNTWYKKCKIGLTDFRGVYLAITHRKSFWVCQVKCVSFLGTIKEDALPVIAGFKIFRISGYELAAYHP